MTEHPLRFLDQLEADWQATQQVLPDRDRRLDGLHDDALTVLCMRAGMSQSDAVRTVASARSALGGDL